MALLILAVPLVASKAQTTATASPEQFSYAPTPQTQAFMRYGNNAVDMNTGALTVSIPVYTYSDNDFELPISATYSSQGLTPGHQTGILGLGWFLNCGGSVSREIQGVPDDRVASDETTGFLLGDDATYCDSDVMNMNKGGLNGTSLQNYVIDGRETTSDTYHFSFNGHSGTFHFDSKKQPHIYNTDGNHGTYTITPIFPENNELHGFVIKTGDGYEYTFGVEGNEQPLNSVERNIGGAFSGNSIFTLSSTSLYDNPIVTWNLTKIKAPNGRFVTFEYQDVESNLNTYIAPQIKNNPFLVTTFTPGLLQKDCFGVEHYRNVSIVQTTYLSKISVSDAAEITFQMSLKNCFDRPSTPNTVNSIEDDHFITQELKKLDCITVKNRSGREIHRTEFTYKIKDNRLLLTKVHTDGVGDYLMSYHEEYPFPSISTADTDFWGFYNGKGNGYNVVSSTKVNSSYNDYIDTDAKNPDWRYSVLGCLKRISYPTGGFSTFKYEPNRADEILLKRQFGVGGAMPSQPDSGQGNVTNEEQIAYLVDIYPYSILFGNSDECGGVRLAQTIDYDNYTGYQSRTYKYSGGIVYTFPKHNTASLHSMQVYNPFLEYPSNSLSKQHICYSNVRETHSDGSCSIYHYSDYHTHPDEYHGQVRQKIETLNSAEYLYDPPYINNILRQPNSNHIKRGRVTAIEHYDNERHLVKRTTFEYEMHDTAYTAYIVTSGKYFSSVKRYTGDYRLVATEETEYYNNDSITTVLQLEHDEKGRVACSATTLPGCDKMYAYTQYNDDASRHLFNQPQCVNKVYENSDRKTLIESIRYDYDVFGEMRLPVGVKKAQLDGNVPYPCDTDVLSYTSLQKIKHYDNHGNPTEIIDEHGVHTAILWGYKGMYPVAKVYGITIAELMSLIGKTDNEPLEKRLSDKERDAILGNTVTPMVDIYEYIPLVGLSRHYTGDDKRIDYGYDTHDRLIRISDDEGKLKEFDYIRYTK